MEGVNDSRETHDPRAVSRPIPLYGILKGWVKKEEKEGRILLYYYLGDGGVTIPLINVASSLVEVVHL
jgi:hypothetical protein